MPVVIKRIILSKNARRQLEKIPVHIVNKLKAWVDSVEHAGLEEVRKLPGYHDEPLHGQRKGTRSIRLSRSYRAIYSLQGSQDLRFVLIEEVHKHDY